jgi:lysophospholipase L1-like esterase
MDVIRSELPRLAELDPGLLTLLVGVNDVVQGVPIDTYTANAATILDQSLGLVPPARIVTVSTPDYTVTPQGAAYGDPARQSAAIRQVNEILARLSEDRGIRHVDIHDLSLRAASDSGLVADDGLHPSGRQYELWVERIGPAVEQLLHT